MCQRLACFAHLCDDAGRTSPRTGRRAGPPECRGGRRAWWRKKQMKRSAANREKGREARRALGFPLLERHDFGFATYFMFIVPLPVGTSKTRVRTAACPRHGAALACCKLPSPGSTTRCSPFTRPRVRCSGLWAWR